MKIKASTIFLSTKEIEFILEGEELIKKARGGIRMGPENCIQPLSEDPPLFYILITKMNLEMLKETGYCKLEGTHYDFKLIK